MRPEFILVLLVFNGDALGEFVLVALAACLCMFVFRLESLMLLLSLGVWGKGSDECCMEDVVADICLFMLLLDILSMLLYAVECDCVCDREFVRALLDTSTLAGFGAGKGFMGKAGPPP